MTLQLHRSALAKRIVMLIACASVACFACGASAAEPTESTEMQQSIEADDSSDKIIDREPAESDDAASREDAAENHEPISKTTPLSEEQMLIEEAKLLLEELHRLRTALAETRLAKAEMQRKLDELRQFIADHREFGRDFESYRNIREMKEREQKQREQREARERYLRERQQRMDRRDAIREMRLEQREAERRDREFRRHGFEPIGMNVYVGRMAYQYRIRDTLRTRITYDPFFGFFTQRDYRDLIDYTEMILSGAVLNASDEVRNIGIAITFFDGSGNQVGHEIVQVNNARPNVPYPFTSTVSMALDRPFATSSSYVLYADLAEPN